MSHWQRQHAVGVDDLVLMPNKLTEAAIADNLRKRYASDMIYTYIGPSLIAINPYKRLGIFSDKELGIYHGANSYENPPHIYAVAERMWQNLIADNDNQCVIISGESGAGKTESSKLVMNYISAVSARARDPTYGNIVEDVKNIITESNPLLESFGNAKTLRNNNSSRFGKYFEINFLRSGSPVGGKISNFLLEKSRVVGIKPGERSFHIFYQLVKAAPRDLKDEFGITTPAYFNYLRASNEYDAEGIDDAEEWNAMRHAMTVCKIDSSRQTEIIGLVAAILHLGNIEFVEKGNEAKVLDARMLDFPAYLLGVSKEELVEKLTSRMMRTGGVGRRSSMYKVPLNSIQSTATRDALAKFLYSRLFDFIVNAVNIAMEALSSQIKGTKNLSIGVLDIYGFEIFERNGFEQFCINFVNERLQQIFIELTLHQEQEEYIQEGIEWVPIDYFNNKVVVDLIESKKPPGIMPILDDACFTMHAVQDGADGHFLGKLTAAVAGNKHFTGGTNFFVVQHYAGAVTYSVDGFTESNKDTLFKDLLALMKDTSNPFLKALFPEEVDWDDRKRPTTAGFKIRNQCQELVTTLMRCVPSYVRCIKPNDTKRAGDFDASRVEHQVRYLNLKENVRVRRAGFCYRGAFDKFFRRYGIVDEALFRKPPRNFKDAVPKIMTAVNMASGEWQLGKSKVFIRSPESLFQLEEIRERKYDLYARKIQRAFRGYLARRMYLQMKKKTVDVLGGRKQRRKHTLNRTYIGDYIGYRDDPVLRMVVGKNEACYFADSVMKYDREFKATTWDMILGNSGIFLVGLEKAKAGPEKGKIVKTLKRKIGYKELSGLSLSTKADDVFVLKVKNSYDQVLKSVFKTEFVVVLSQKFLDNVGTTLNIEFTDTMKYTVKKTTFQSGGEYELRIVLDPSCPAEKFTKITKTSYEVRIAPGLPPSSVPKIAESSPSKERRVKPEPKRALTMAPMKESLPFISVAAAPALPVSNILAAPTSTSSNRGGMVRPNVPTQSDVRTSANMGATNRSEASKYGTVRSSQPSAIGSGRPESRSFSQPDLLRPIAAGVTSVSVLRDRLGSSPNLAMGGKVPSSGTMRGGYSRSSLVAIDDESSKPDLFAQALATRKAAAPPPPPRAKQLPQCRAVYDYVAQDGDELSFNAGDVISIAAKDDPGWWSGVLKGKKGLFPHNYVKEIK